MTKENVSCYAQRICLGLSLMLLLVLSACSGISVGGSSGVTPPTIAPTAPSLNVNLITNGNAEAGPGTDNAATIEPIPGWTRQGAIDVVQYAPSNGGYIALTDPGPSDRGKNYFSGGLNNALSSMTQTVDISAASPLLSQGNIQFTLSAWLGGFLNQDDNAKLTIQFVSANGQVLSTASVGPLLAAERHNLNGLVQSSTTGKVPAGAAKVVVTLTMTREAGGYNDGSADDLSLVFHL